MKRLGWAALVVAMLGTSASPVWAAGPGNGWVKVGEETVRYFLPGSTPPQDGALAPASQATSLAKGADFQSNEWVLIGTEKVRYFLSDPGNDGAQKVGSAFLTSHDESQQFYVGRSPKVFGAVTRDPSQQGARKLVDSNGSFKRYEIPVTQVVHTAWTIFDQYGLKTRTIVTNQVTYRLDQPQRTTAGDVIQDTRQFTRLEDTPGEWAFGSALDALNQTYATGSETVTVALDSIYQVDSNLASDVRDVVAAAGPSRSASFTSDAVSGSSKTKLGGGKARVVFRADDAMATVTRSQTSPDGATTLTGGGVVSGPGGTTDASGSVTSGGGQSSGSGTNATGSGSGTTGSGSGTNASGSGSGTNGTGSGTNGTSPSAGNVNPPLTATAWAGSYAKDKWKVVIELTTNRDGDLAPKLTVKKKKDNGRWTNVGYYEPKHGKISADFGSFSESREHKSINLTLKYNSDGHLVLGVEAKGDSLPDDKFSASLIKE